MIILIIIYMILSAGGLILFKLGSSNSIDVSLTKGMFNMRISYMSILGIFSYGISFLLYMGLVTKYNLSYIVPITSGIIQVLILLASAFIFRETISNLNIVGAILVIIGVVLINY